jgi:serine/threonine-protein kinase
MDSGVVVVADDQYIRLISPLGIVTTLAGSGNDAWADGIGSQASFNRLFGVAVMASGAVVVADTGNHRIRLVSPLGIVTTWAGSGHHTWADGVGSQASFSYPSGLAVMASGVVLVADAGNNRIRLISPSGMVTTLAGSGYPAWADGLGSQVRFNGPKGVAVTASGAVVVAEDIGNRIRQSVPYNTMTDCPEGSSGQSPYCVSCPRGHVCPAGNAQ